MGADPKNRFLQVHYFGTPDRLIKFLRDLLVGQAQALAQFDED